MMSYLYNDASKKAVRRTLRTFHSPIEDRLWQHIRNSRLAGSKFRRQYGVGPYIVDFYCPRERLAIELDGESHVGQEAYEKDQIRTAFLERNGIRVIRFHNTDVLNNIEGVLEAILLELHK